jgi:hypothetical protein
MISNGGVHPVIVIILLILMIFWDDIVIDFDIDNGIGVVVLIGVLTGC